MRGDEAQRSHGWYLVSLHILTDSCTSRAAALEAFLAAMHCCAQDQSTSKTCCSRTHLFFSASEALRGAWRGLGWFMTMLPCQPPMAMDRHTPLEGSSGSTV